MGAVSDIANKVTGGNSEAIFGAVGTAFGGPVGGLIAGQVGSSLFGAQTAEEAAGIEAGGIQRGADVNVEELRRIASGFEPLEVGATEAAELEAALSGALGPEAQALAFENIQASPFQKFVERSGRRQLDRGFAATGGLGGGERLKALTQFGQDIASGTIADQLANLRAVRASGTGVARTRSELLRQAAGAEGAGIARAAGARATGVRERGAEIQEGVEGVFGTLALRDRINRLAV